MKPYFFSSPLPNIFFLPEENEKHEKLHLECEQEQKKASVQRVNHAVHPEEPHNELPAVPLSPPVPAPLPAAPISVIPIPVVTSPPQQAAQSTLSPPLIPRHQPLVSKEAALVAPVIQRTSGPLLPDIKALTPPSGSPKQLPHYAAPVLAISQHHVVQHPIQPQLPPLQQQHPVAPQPHGALKLAPSEEAKPSEQKKRPGG